MTRLSPIAIMSIYAPFIQRPSFTYAITKIASRITQRATAKIRGDRTQNQLQAMTPVSFRVMKMRVRIDRKPGPV